MRAAGPTVGENEMGVYYGNRGKETVVAFASADSSTFFAPLTDLFKEGPLAVISASGGEKPERVDWTEVAGLASPDVSRVSVVSTDGSDHPVSLINGTFTYSAVTPADFPTSVTAYDQDGRLLGERAVPLAAPFEDG